MAVDGVVRLIWEVDPRGYDIVSWDRRDPRTPENIRFLRKLGDVHPYPPKAGDVMEFIVPRSGKPRQYERGMLKDGGIFLDLANSARRPEHAGVLEFVNKWGLLGTGFFGPSRIKSRPRTRAEGSASLEEFLDSRDCFLKLALGKSTHDSLERLGRDVRRGADGDLGALDINFRGTRYILQATSLLQFCVLELFHHTEGNIDLMACGACGKLLPLHKKGRPKRYCDDVCKTAAWRAKHRSAINRRRRESRARK